MRPSARTPFVVLSALLFLAVIAPGPAAASTPAVHAGLQVNWQQAHSTGLGMPLGFPASAFANGTYVVSSDANQGGRIWASSDAHNWTVVWSGNDTPSPIVAGGPGFVAWSSGILLSKNGHKWTRADDALPQRLLNSDFPQLGSVAGVVVAFSDSGHGYWSADGRNWNSISGGPRKPVTLAGDGTHLWAFTGGHDFDSGTRSRVELWVTSDGQHWTQSAHLPQSNGAEGLSAAFGPLGGVVIGGARAWYSADDIHWHLATNSPTRVNQKGSVFTDDVVADESGFIVAAQHDPPGCALDPEQIRALTWTSVDGKVWRMMPAKGWLGLEIDQLFISGRTLFGLGIDWRNNGQSPVEWHAQLPSTATDNAPPPPPLPKPGRQGC